MTDTTALVNHQVRLAKRPEGAATREHWSFGSEPVAQPAEGGVLVKTLSLSLDPAMRGWLNDAKSYIPPVEIGAVMRAGGIGRVIASKNPQFAVGDTVYGTLNVQEYMLIPQEEIKRNGLVKIDLRVGSITQWLNVLGMPGMTGYFGLMDVGQPKAGETVVISGAAGAVGQTVGQLAKIKGCRVVGIAGGEAKCDWVVKELGFDACLDRHDPALAERLAAACPKGIDVYFENVGGPVFDAVLPLFNIGARVPVCGHIADYNADGETQGTNRLPLLMASLLQKRIRMQGFVILDHYGERFEAFRREMGDWIERGEVRPMEDIVEGLEHAPAGFIGLLQGRNFGKRVVRVADEN